MKQVEKSQKITTSQERIIFNELKSELVIQSGYIRYMKTKLIVIGKDLECESRELGPSKIRKIHSR